MDDIFSISDKGKFYKIAEIVLRKAIAILDYCLNKKEEWRLESKYLFKHRLGCLLSDISKIEESLLIHKEVLDWRLSTKNPCEIQASYHSIGTLYLQDQQYDKVNDIVHVVFFKKCREQL